MFGLYTPSAETEHYVLGHFRPNMFGGRIFGASLLLRNVPHVVPEGAYGGLGGSWAVPW